MRAGEMLILVKLALTSYTGKIYVMQIAVTMRPHCPSRR
jgi:hypothetical protein